MRNWDFERRKLQEICNCIALSILSPPQNDFGSDISLPDIPHGPPARGAQLQIPIIHSEPVQGSTVPLPTSERMTDLPSEFGVTSYSESERGSGNGSNGSKTG
ncbi:hypothetical protein EK21DRAFT_94336 [Setomelanomma holmii]|uniref:Uncharacterized protein n=1 Tax=Setomelanomma holmii TaxID=210430 RepID=A0A9P4GY51_9PLEO|nr:hypothetical protein EK21DRAFT_94336 [Setomelanomma holmii]